MKAPFRSSRVARWLILMGMCGLLPAFFLQCDKAALNLQRGFFWGLGQDLSGLAINQIPGVGG